jgi:hypothetical protein
MFLHSHSPNIHIWSSLSIIFFFAAAFSHEKLYRGNNTNVYRKLSRHESILYCTLSHFSCITSWKLTMSVSWDWYFSPCIFFTHECMSSITNFKLLFYCFAIFNLLQTFGLISNRHNDLHNIFYSYNVIIFITNLYCIYIYIYTFLRTHEYILNRKRCRNNTGHQS